MANEEDVGFVLDIVSLAAVDNNDCVVFRQQEGIDSVASAIILVGNPTKITYIPGGESAGKLREEQWFAVHCIASTDRNKSARQCWDENDPQSHKIKRLRAKFETARKNESSSIMDKGLLSSRIETASSDSSNGERSARKCESTLHCVPSKSIHFEAVKGRNMKRLFTTMSFVNSTKVRRAVQVFCPLDPEFKGFHVETFAVDPRSQYDLTMCFLPSRSFREQAKVTKPYIIVTHIEAADSSKSAKEIWEEHNKTPNAKCAVKRIPIEYDDSALDALLNEHEIDKRYILTRSDSEKNNSSADSNSGSSDDQQSIPSSVDTDLKQNAAVKDGDEKFTRKRKEEMTGVDAFERSIRDNCDADQHAEENNNGQRESDELDPASRPSNTHK
uniref:Major sperm protein n=1 Tax=Ascaris lumbricoides TaxID=6252 RepID=A0A0M3IC01_ASCLU